MVILIHLQKRSVARWTQGCEWRFILFLLWRISRLRKPDILAQRTSSKYLSMAHCKRWMRYKIPWWDYLPTWGSISKIAYSCSLLNFSILQRTFISFFLLKISLAGLIWIPKSSCYILKRINWVYSERWSDYTFTLPNLADSIWWILSESTRWP